MYNENCVVVGAYNTILKLCRINDEGDKFSHLAYCNFLKCDKSVIKVCFLPYSNHLKRRRKLEFISPLQKVRKSYRIIESDILLLHFCFNKIRK